MNYTDEYCEEYFENMLINASDIFSGKGNYTGIWKTLQTDDYIQIVAVAVIIVGGLLGNISVILTVILNESMRTTVNIYVTNLAFADALICIICMIPHAIDVAVNDDAFIFGEFMCKLNPFTQITCLISSVLTLSAISFDRFLVVVFPTRMIGVKRRTSLVIIIIWTVSATVAIPLLFFKQNMLIQYENNFIKAECGEYWPATFYYDKKNETCAFYNPLRISYYLVICTSLYFVPIIIMISAYSLIAWTVWFRPGAQQQFPGEQCDSNTVIYSRTRRKVNLMVFSVLIAFIICWTPFQVIVMYAALKDKSAEVKDVVIDMKWAAYFLAYSNSFINPIIYGGFNKSFRDGFSIILRCGFTRRQIGRLARSIQTLTTNLTSSVKQRVTKVPTGDKNNSPGCNVEMKIVQPAVTEAIASTSKNTCVAIAKTGDQDFV